MPFPSERRRYIEMRPLCIPERRGGRPSIYIFHDPSTQYITFWHCALLRCERSNLEVAAWSGALGVLGCCVCPWWIPPPKRDIHPKYSSYSPKAAVNVSYSNSGLNTFSCYNFPHSLHTRGVLLLLLLWPLVVPKSHGQHLLFLPAPPPPRCQPLWLHGNQVKWRTLWALLNLQLYQALTPFQLIFIGNPCYLSISRNCYALNFCNKRIPSHSQPLSIQR